MLEKHNLEIKDLLKFALLIENHSECHLGWDLFVSTEHDRTVVFLLSALLGFSKFPGNSSGQALLNDNNENLS